MYHKLIGASEHHRKGVTIGKVYKLSLGTFTDDEGETRNIGPYSWSFISEDKPTPLVPVTRKDIVAMSNAFGTQEDGRHYTDMELQPLEMTYLRYGIEGLKAAIHTKVDKYITRKKNDEVIQYKKAAHCMQILIEMTELDREHYG